MPTVNIEVFLDEAGKVNLRLDKLQLLEHTKGKEVAGLDEAKLRLIAETAAKCCHTLRFNNKLWANASMKPLENLLEEAGLYTPPVDQG